MIPRKNTRFQALSGGKIREPIQMDQFRCDPDQAGGNAAGIGDQPQELISILP